jgi:hypothetical protein
MTGKMMATHGIELVSFSAEKAYAGDRKCGVSVWSEMAARARPNVLGLRVLAIRSLFTSLAAP